MKKRSLKWVLSLVMIIGVVFNSVGQDEKLPPIPDKVKKEFNKLAEEQTTILDTCVTLNDTTRKVAFDLNYEYLENTYHDQLKLDSLNAEALKLKQKINKQENQKQMKLKKLVPKEKYADFRKYRKINRSHTVNFNKNRKPQN